MGRSEVIILGWLALSFPEDDAAVTSTKLACKDPERSQENELTSPHGSETGMLCSGADKSEVVAEDGFVTQKLENT
jgi:hypothetical protein